MVRLCEHLTAATAEHKNNTLNPARHLLQCVRGINLPYIGKTNLVLSLGFTGGHLDARAGGHIPPQGFYFLIRGGGYFILYRGVAAASARVCAPLKSILFYWPL